MILLILAVIWFAGVLYWDVQTDFKKWKLGIPVKHRKEAIVRSLLLAPVFIGLIWNYLPTNFGRTIYYSFVTLGLMFSIWWELFDGFYNKKRGYSWRFNGTVDPDDSKLDRILYGLNNTQETILKWGLILIFLILYLVT